MLVSHSYLRVRSIIRRELIIARLRLKIALFRKPLEIDSVYVTDIVQSPQLPLTIRINISGAWRFNLNGKRLPGNTQVAILQPNTGHIILTAYGRKKKREIICELQPEHVHVSETCRPNIEIPGYFKMHLDRPIAFSDQYVFEIGSFKPEKHLEVQIPSFYKEFNSKNYEA